MPPTPAWYEEFTRLGEWITAVPFDGTVYGGSYRADLDQRLLRFIEHLRSTGVQYPRILECGCLEGGHTAKIGEAFPDAAITAVDFREGNLERARLLMRICGINNVRFLQDDLDAPASAFSEDYDAIFCVGLLYHLKDPFPFLRRCVERAPLLWLWTVYCAEDAVETSRDGHRGRIYREPGEHPLNGVYSESYLPTLGGLIEMLFEAGYCSAEILDREMTKNDNGPAVLLAAKR